MKSMRERQSDGGRRGSASTVGWTPRFGLIALVVGITLGIAACGSTGQDAPEPVDPNKSALAISPQPVPSASAAASSESKAAPGGDTYQAVDLEAPRLSDVAAEPSVDGAEAYAYFLFHGWAYAIQSNDVDWWRGNAQGSAPWLESIAHVLVEGAHAGTAAKVADFQPYTVRRGTNPDNPDEHVVVLQAQVDTIYEVSRDGAQAVDTPAMLTEFAVILSYTDGRWLIKDAEMTQAQGQQ